MEIEVLEMLRFKNYFYEKYSKRSLSERISLARSYYQKLQNQVNSSDLFELLCVLCGANGGLTEQKYRIFIELTHDRGSIEMLRSLISSMYTPYTVQRVCESFTHNIDAMEGAVNILFLFASLNGRLSSDDEKMMRIIMNK